MQLASPKQLHQIERPREKLAAKGAAALSNAELLQIIIGSGGKYANVTVIADAVNSLLSDQTIEVKSLLKIRGLSTAKAAAILSAIELGKRVNDTSQPVITSPADIIPLVSEYSQKKQEHLVVFTIDGAGHILNRRLITIGTLTNTLVHPREVFADAVGDRAASVILVHNHPSGDPSPSVEDKQVTKVLAQVGEILGISLQDHVIIAGSRWVSLRQLGLL